jgi:O-6-methylguanine DNA methyltransferase
MESLYYTEVDSPVGKLVVAVSERGVVKLEFPQRTQAQKSVDSPSPAQATLVRECERQLREYFAGERREFTVPLDLRGTQFQVDCWNALLAIPHGETRTYADIARVVGRPQGFRAVGLANNRNPIAIIIPCHRVIASDGTLCGYGGGLDLKRKLLELEGALAVAQPALIA